ncbi:MAG: hypothetical protein AAF629_35555 [Chloroflexota bacterium]
MAKKYPVQPPVAIREAYEEGCDHCKGTGQEPTLRDLTCRECFGRGRLRWRIDECDECQGRGRTGKYVKLFKCKSCLGRGWKARDIG